MGGQKIAKLCPRCYWMTPGPNVFILISDVFGLLGCLKMQNYDIQSKNAFFLKKPFFWGDKNYPPPPGKQTLKNKLVPIRLKTIS